MWSDKYSDDPGEAPQQNITPSFWNPFELNTKKLQSTKINELDLSSFKTQKCQNQDPNHNKKHCVKYHNDNDRRRNPSQFNYKCDFCPNGRNCAYQESCDLSHNKVEQLYHPNRYKSKYCQSKVEDCEYGIFCTFAHSDDEINIPLKLHLMTQDQNFWLNSYKTIWCPYIQNHDRADCVYAHNAQDFRRDPAIYKYNPIDCPNWMKKKQQQVTTYEQGGCQQMANCLNCHGWKELEYHPLNYRTKRCLHGDLCKKRNKDCSYFHCEQERRMKWRDSDPSKKPPPPPYKIEQQDSHSSIKVFAQRYKSKEPQFAEKKTENGLMKRKLQIGQPFEVFSSNSMTNHTASGSRKMSESSQESKSMQDYNKQPQRKKEQSPKKNRSAPSSPPEIQVPYILNFNDDQVMENFTISLPYQKPLIYSTQFITRLQKYQKYEILNILQTNNINEFKIINMKDDDFDKLLILTNEQIQVVKAVVGEMKQDIEDFMKQVDTQF